MARRWASAEICAARRISSSSLASFSRRISSSSLRTSRISPGAETPVRAWSRTAFNHRIKRASHSLFSPTSEKIAGWSASSFGSISSSCLIE